MTNHPSASESGELNLDHLEAERAAFEKWAGPCRFERFADGGYVDHDLDHSWASWKARADLANQPAPTVPAGFAIVPLNPNQDQVKAGLAADPHAYHVTDIYVSMISAHQPAQEQAKPCVICGSDEPRTGTCGSDDPRALCKQAPVAAPKGESDD